MKIITDTNFLIYLAKFNLLDQLNYFSKIILLKPILKELVILGKNEKEKNEDKIATKIAIQFFEKIKDKIEYFNIGSYADDAIIEFAKEQAKIKEIAVGTMDRELIKRLKKEKIKIIIIRQKKFLEEI